MKHKSKQMVYAEGRKDKTTKNKSMLCPQKKKKKKSEFRRKQSTIDNFDSVEVNTCKVQEQASLHANACS